jgi:hypothetical protein
MVRARDWERRRRRMRMMMIRRSLRKRMRWRRRVLTRSKMMTIRILNMCPTPLEDARRVNAAATPRSIC